MQIGYCTNVHAGPDLKSTQANLLQYAAKVKEQFSPNEPMGIGLWLAAPAAVALKDPSTLNEFRSWLNQQELVPFTLNGFPYGDFHSEVVKHQVYQPTWFEEDRLTYTTNLIDALHELLPAGMEGSISTLPVAWNRRSMTPPQWLQTSQQLLQLCQYLHQLEQETGRLIYVCLEPEPGCVLDVAKDMIDLFQERLLPFDDDNIVTRYLRICHDICHSAVMFEAQADVLRKYQQLGIRVGKIQVSSAVRVDFATIDTAHRAAALEQLRSFNEPRYLHQTSIRHTSGQTKFHEDLDLALATVKDPTQLTNTWSVHFHVPVYLQTLGLLGTSQNDILDCFDVCKSMPDLKHFEVETYAWNVLPEEHQVSNLADGIAKEMTWVKNQLDNKIISAI